MFILQIEPRKINQFLLDESYHYNINIKDFSRAKVSTNNSRG